MEEKNKEGCCKDEHRHFKLKIDHQKTKIAQFINQVFTASLAVPVIDFRFHSSIIGTESYPICHAPPDTRKERLHIFHCVFLI